MKISSRRLLSISGVLMLLGALLHTIGFLTPNSDPGVVGVENSMRNFRFTFGMGMNPSMFDVFMTLVLTMSVTFTGFGILNLVLAGARDLRYSLLRRVIWINVLWVAAFIAIALHYRVPPPLISGIVIELPLIAALLVKNPG